MKKFFILGLLLVMLCTTMTAFACTEVGCPSGNNQAQVYELNNAGEPVAISSTDPAGKARCYKQTINGGRGYDELATQCNKNRKLYFEITADVAQWMNVKLDSNAWHWHVRKPGTYIADCIGLQVESNNDVDISCSVPGLSKNMVDKFSVVPTTTGRGDHGDDDRGHGNPPGENSLSTNDSVEKPEVTFCVKDNGQVPNGSEFVDITGGSISLDDENPLFNNGHPGSIHIDKKLWNKLYVSEYVANGEYITAGAINFTIKDFRSWINRETGQYDH